MHCYRKTPDALARIMGGREYPLLKGCVMFYQEKGNVLMVARISGLPIKEDNPFFAIHIHEGNNCLGPDFSGTGGHYNPMNAEHPNHAGDLPPLLQYSGHAYLAVRTDRFSVRDIIGKTVVIHSDADDFRSQPSGNAGQKIACGVIGRTVTPEFFRNQG